ncbi:FAD-dependent monooxygenase [Balamuthia mandrillaris]
MEQQRMLQKNHRPHAVIIGGGIAGCALGLFLACESGFRVSIFEAYSRTQAVNGGIGGGLQLAPNGMRVLKHLGLAERLRRLGVESPCFEFRGHDGHLIVRTHVDPKGRYDQPSVLMTRATLHQVLVEAVEHEQEQNNNTTIEFDKRLVGASGIEAEDEAYDLADANSGPVMLQFEDGSRACGDLVVCADGVHSKMRSLLLGEDDPKACYLGLVSLGGFAHSDIFLEKPESEQGVINFLFSPEGSMMGYCRATGDDPRLVMWWRNMQVANHPKLMQLLGLSSAADERLYQPPTKEELQAMDTDELKRCILHLPGGEEWSPVLRQMVEDTDTILRGTISDVVHIPRWAQGRACLIGDAAHAVSPHSGQGASLALEDSMFLAKMLRLALHEHRSRHEHDDEDLPFPITLLQRAFKAYEHGRKARVEKIVAEGRRRGEQRRNTKEEPSGPGAVKRWLIEGMMYLAFKHLAQPLFGQVFGYRIEWDDGKTLRQIEAEQREQASGAWAKTVGTAVILTAVLVPVVALLLHRR